MVGEEVEIALERRHPTGFGLRPGHHPKVVRGVREVVPRLDRGEAPRAAHVPGQQDGGPGDQPEALLERGWVPVGPVAQGREDRAERLERRESFGQCIEQRVRELPGTVRWVRSVSTMTGDGSEGGGSP